MRLITTNFTQESQTNITASSSNVNYPVSNISHQFRSKTWRSSGNFVIDATNNKINFKESGGGAELTATITSGTYTSTTLAAEIKTQLETVGAETYTVSQSSSTGLWTVSHAGSYLSLLNNTGTNQAVSILKVAMGFANSDRTGATAYTGSNIAIHTSEWITFDLQTTEDINSVVLLWPKEDGIRLSSTAVVKIQASATDVWTTPVVNETLTIDDTFSISSHYFTTDKSYRYWRVVITDPTNPNLWVDLGVVVLGKSESIDTADNGFTYMQSDSSSVIRTEYGNEYVDEYPINKRLKLNFNVLDYSDTLILDAAYKANGVRKPVFIVMDETSLVTNKNLFSIYGKFQENLEIGHINYDLFKTELEIREIN